MALDSQNPVEQIMDSLKTLFYIRTHCSTHFISSEVEQRERYLLEFVTLFQMSKNGTVIETFSMQADFSHC